MYVSAGFFRTHSQFTGQSDVRRPMLQPVRLQKFEPEAMAASPTVLVVGPPARDDCALFYDIMAAMENTSFGVFAAGTGLSGRLGALAAAALASAAGGGLAASSCASLASLCDEAADSHTGTALTDQELEAHVNRQLQTHRSVRFRKHCIVVEAGRVSDDMLHGKTVRRLFLNGRCLKIGLVIGLACEQLACIGAVGRSNTDYVFLSSGLDAEGAVAIYDAFLSPNECKLDAAGFWNVLCNLTADDPSTCMVIDTRAQGERKLSWFQPVDRRPRVIDVLPCIRPNT